MVSPGSIKKASLIKQYIDHILGYINLALLKPLKIVVNPGNGVAGNIIDQIEKRFLKLGVPIEFIKINHLADGNFPNGVPNPLIVSNRFDTCNAILSSKADLGIAWDSDFDRCFINHTKKFLYCLYTEVFICKCTHNTHKNFLIKKT